MFGLSAPERLARQLARLRLAAPERLRVADGVVVDTPALAHLIAGPPATVVDASGATLIEWDGGGTAVVAGTAGFFNTSLKKRETFLAFALDKTPVREIEDAFYYASYKGVTDIVTKYAWPVPALAVVRACVALRISPNMVTLVSILLSIAALPLFAGGWFGWGLACAWGMTFLDTVDGKLARVTVSYSKFGSYFDHIPDLVFPPLWWWAAMIGLRDAAPELADELTIAFWVVIATYLVGRLCEGVFELRHRFVPFVWRPRDARFRLVLARRNPNLIILTAGAVTDVAAESYLVMAGWCAVCAVIQLWNLVESEWTRRRGPLVSYLA
ncbi:CDP-alcohol phosphatidyltransferase family protein [Glacieibacterium frigidum]|uniref:CDP-alcohol phosphatidyltransferase family protein n=1 Tax=Glacieibacterium frigidum TaxID=2593303 RepID=A0A552UGS0_9SPHN|nr:CDP-alcohol phosphatidyltransferase family protein [Glacieibacterium frigidum]TRW17410.1 CDP-alcohol phosphatidyltransferase family protein [Glacieibacterium frigidum]